MKTHTVPLLLILTVISVFSSCEKEESNTGINFSGTWERNTYIWNGVTGSDTVYFLHKGDSIYISDKNSVQEVAYFGGDSVFITKTWVTGFEYLITISPTHLCSNSPVNRTVDSIVFSKK